MKRTLLLLVFVSGCVNYESLSRGLQPTNQRDGSPIIDTDSGAVYDTDAGVFVYPDGAVVGTDGGQSNIDGSLPDWETLTSGTTAWLTGIWIDSADNLCVVSGSADILSSTDHGDTWVKKTAPIPWLISIWGDGTYLYALSTAMLYRSSTCGSTWETMTTPTATGFQAISGSGNDIYIADKGKLLRSSDQGVTWTSLPVPLSTATVYGLWVTGSFIYAVASSGSSAFIYTSSDRGATWASFSSGILFNVWGRSAGDVFVSGYTVLHTTNAGINWTQKWTAGCTVGTDCGLHGMWEDAKGLYAVDWSGQLWTTTDSGDHWSSLTLSSVKSLNGIRGDSAGRIFVVGDKGAIFRRPAP